MRLGSRGLMLSILMLAFSVFGCSHLDVRSTDKFKKITQGFLEFKWTSKARTLNGNIALALSSDYIQAQLTDFSGTSVITMSLERNRLKFWDQVEDCYYEIKNLRKQTENSLGIPIDIAFINQLLAPNAWPVKKTIQFSSSSQENQPDLKIEYVTEDENNDSQILQISVRKLGSVCILKWINKKTATQETFRKVNINKLAPKCSNSGAKAIFRQYF